MPLGPASGVAVLGVGGPERPSGRDLLGSLGTAVYRHEIAAAVPSMVPSEAAEAARDALFPSVEVTTLTGAAIATAAAIGVAVLLRRPRQQSEPEPEPGATGTGTNPRHDEPSTRAPDPASV